MFNHLFHRTILYKLAILIAVHAVIFVLRAVGIRTEDFFSERHSATLTKSLFHTFFLFVINVFDGANLLIVAESAKFLGYSAWFCDE